MVTNEHKEVDDSKLAGKIKSSRERKHNKTETANENQLTIGDNVLLKADKTKLKARQPNKVVETFMKNSEPWATVQKHDSQFRAKQYKVKEAELVKLPGQDYKREIEEELQPINAPDELIDEFADITYLSCKVLRTISKQMLKLTDIYRPSRDYEKLVEQLEEDEDFTTEDHGNERPIQENNSGTDENDDDSSAGSTSTLVSSHEEDMGTSNEPTSEGWSTPNTSPTTPSNSPTDAARLSRPVTAGALRSALRRTIEDLENFNAIHPSPPPPPRRSSRSNLYEVMI